NHWRKVPAFKTLVLKIVADDSTRLAQVQSGDLDVAPIPLSLKPEAQSANLKIASIPSIGVSNMYLGGQFPGYPYNDPKSPWIQADNPDKGLAIRKALSFAIDRKAILNKVLFGTGELIAAPICFPPGLAFDDTTWKLPAYDTGKAKQMLAQGGYPAGFTLNSPIFNPPGRPSSSAIGEAVAGMWEAIGVKVNRQPMDFTTMRAKLVARSTAGLAWQWTAPFYDEPLDALHISYVSTGASANFYDPDITAAVASMSAQPSQSKRFATARSLGTKLIADVRAIPLFTVGSATTIGGKVKSWVFVNGNAEFHNPEYLAP
ncbi:MAG: ABC transporter substrate-binding protein, partial [Candidatus Dormibacteraceae bacterium]